MKSTCHICHSAAGPNPGPQQLLDGAIPPLSTITTRKSNPDFVRKITSGAPVVMGSPVLSYRGRMPVFGYLSKEEAADVYLYLTQYPPRDVVTLATPSAASTSLNASGGPLSTSGATHDDTHGSGASRRRNAARTSLIEFALFPALLFCLLGAVLVKGLPLALVFHRGSAEGSDPVTTTLSQAAPVGAEACTQCNSRSHPSPYRRLTAPAAAIGERHGES